tara:strand:+ start:2501 stop:2632 length:132 start_codon:yes stop_codon:yes gene_type:complete
MLIVTKHKLIWDGGKGRRDRLFPYCLEQGVVVRVHLPEPNKYL